METPKLHNNRTHWVNMMDKICKPVFTTLVSGEPFYNFRTRTDRSTKMPAFEAFARCTLGLSSWLELDRARLGSVEERCVHDEYRKNVLASFEAFFGEDSKSQLFISIGDTSNPQMLVELAFLAVAFYRSPWLVSAIPKGTRKRIALLFSLSRDIRPLQSNWLLFSAMIEVGQALLGNTPDQTRIDYALSSFERWYVGDGFYKDGEHFAFDYYNSIVIHPFIETISLWRNTQVPNTRGFETDIVTLLNRGDRYLSHLHKMIHPSGSFAPVGRSLTYRSGCFHFIAFRASFLTMQSREILWSVIVATLESDANYNEQGFLVPGLSGYQPGAAEPYISSGSLYACMFAFLPLGLRSDQSFWNEPARNKGPYDIYWDNGEGPTKPERALEAWREK